MRLSPICPPQLRLALAGLVIALAACGGAPAETAEPLPRPVRVAAVTQGAGEPPVVAIGSLSLREETRLSFKVGGVLRERPVREGERVRAGQRLAALDTAEVDASVAQARAAHEKALRDLERGRRLAADKVLSQQQVDDLATAETVARAQLRAAEFNRRHAIIVAPADGTVLRRVAETNELVAAGQPVLLLGAEDSGFVLRAGVTDAEVMRLRIGDPVRVQVDAWRGETFDGRISEIGGAADPRTGTFGIEIAVDPGARRLASGMIARAVIESHGESRDYVPLDALVEGDAQGTVLFLLDGQRVREQRVPVAFIHAGMAALGERLPAGSRVVTDGASYLRDGETVRIID